MDPSMFNLPGPSNYAAINHQFNPDSTLPPHFPTQHQLTQSQDPYAYSAQPSFASSPSSDSHQQEDPLPTPAPNGGPFVEPHQDLNEFLESFWTRQMDIVEREEQDGKVNVCLPLARIKKVMKSDEEVKMISAEVPIMFSKACEVFISELTCRAWLVAESHKRRTLQKSDVAAAIAHSDMFDFLIDIIPRDGEEPADDQSKAPSVEGEDGEGPYQEYANGQ